MLDVAEEKPTTSIKPTEKTRPPDESELWEEESTFTHAPNRPETLQPKGTGSSGELAIVQRELPPAPPGFTRLLVDESDRPPRGCGLTGQYTTGVLAGSRLLRVHASGNLPQPHDCGGTVLVTVQGHFLDIPTVGPPITSKPYIMPLKYHESVDHKIKQLEEVDILSRSMSDWASPILVVPKKEECAEISNNTSDSKNSKFNR